MPESANTHASSLDGQSKLEMAERLNTELERLDTPRKAMSRNIGASENTLGHYTRGNVPDQWLYLQKLHGNGVDIRFVLLGSDPEFTGLTGDESALLSGYRQLTPSLQEAITNLILANVGALATAAR